MYFDGTLKNNRESGTITWGSVESSYTRQLISRGGPGSVVETDRVTCFCPLIFLVSFPPRVIFMSSLWVKEKSWYPNGFLFPGQDRKGIVRISYEYCPERHCRLDLLQSCCCFSIFTWLNLLLRGLGGISTTSTGHGDRWSLESSTVSPDARTSLSLSPTTGDVTRPKSYGSGRVVGPIGDRTRRRWSSDGSRKTNLYPRCRRLTCKIGTTTETRIGPYPRVIYKRLTYHLPRFSTHFN